MTPEVFCALAIMACGAVATYQTWQAEIRINVITKRLSKKIVEVQGKARVVDAYLEALSAESLEEGTDRIADLLDLESLVRKHWSIMPNDFKGEIVG